jgi:hypothetical protein
MPNPSFNLIGINYQESKSVSNPNFRAESIAYFKALKAQKSPNTPFDIRIMVKAQYQSIPYPFVLGTSNGVDNFAYHHDMAVQFAADPDFRVIFNVYAGPLTRDSFALSRQSILQYAQLLKDLGVNLELSIGNELADSFGIQYGVASCTRSGTTATLVCTGAAFLTHVGDTFTFWNTAPSNWTGTYTVDSYDGNRTITFTVSNTLSASATGGIYSMGVVELNASLRQLATDIKAINPNQKVSVGEFNKVVNGVSNCADWTTNGRGDLDYVSMHLYPGTFKNILPPTETALMIALGPDHSYVSEFNFDSGSNTGKYLTERGVNLMRNIYHNLDVAGASRVVIWSWDTNLNQHNLDGSFHPAWFVLSTNNERMPLEMYGYSRSVISSRTTNSRTAVTERVSV